MKIDYGIYDKLLRYCTYRERASSEAAKKLWELGVKEDAQDLYLKELKEDKLLDDERFARSYAEGKSRIKGWGKQKIRMHLIHLRVPKGFIETALKDIADEEYYARVKELAEAKLARVKASNDYDKKAKVYRYLKQKGYESDVIHRVLFE